MGADFVLDAYNNTPRQSWNSPCRKLLKMVSIKAYQQGALAVRYGSISITLI